ncbi:MAG: ribosome biogenesis GTP-binding protein YihA/YsxC [Tissierellia bacterium]|nr:ribosome biogenesis GTP-binding protein YihA/YsxC [Tissierellia bacterium]
MKIKEAKLECMAAYPKDYPAGDMVEFAFAGRSNVGKSSFINSMANRKKLAYTSSKPGKTRTVNFYKVNNIRFVDLPGYGYAAVSKKEKKNWADVINRYLEQRESLMEVFLLVDGRHEPSAEDKNMYQWLIENGFSGLVIATKMDKVPKTRRLTHLKKIAQAFELSSHEQIIPYSTNSKKYRDEMWWIIEDIINHYKG